MAVVIHVALMIGAVVTLPLSIATGWGRPPAVGEAFWLIGLFAVSIGLPFFALSANAPLLQAWFARTGHPSARDPYFLYAASNVGSFLALLSYPVLVEPFVRLNDQTRLWSVGFIVLIVLIAGCGALLWRSPAKLPDATSEDAADAAPPTWRDALTWVALAAVPSGLLVAVTAHISIDVAAVPLLWVLPLALYLLTFIIVFARRPIVPHWLVVDVQPLFIIGFIAVVIFEPMKTIVGLIAVHLVVFFVCALVCHGELARRRPPAKYLTGFYLWMSVGGMIGGIAAALVAPHTFTWVAEYPILIALAVLCRPGLALPQSLPLRYALFGCNRGWRAGARLVGERHGGDDRSHVPPHRLCAASGQRAVLARAAAVRRDRGLRTDCRPRRVRTIRLDRNAQLLRYLQGRGIVGRPVSRAAARHHDAWRPAHPRRQWPAGDGAAGAPALLL